MSEPFEEDVLERSSSAGWMERAIKAESELAKVQAKQEQWRLDMQACTVSSYDRYVTVSCDDYDVRDRLIAALTCMKDE